jgi:hypothetical protein
VSGGSSLPVVAFPLLRGRGGRSHIGYDEGAESTLLVPGASDLCSPPIRGRAHLGHALAVWAPRATMGPDEDPPELG